MPPITVIDRKSGQLFEEKVFGKDALALVYGDTLLARLIGRPLFLPLVRTSPFAKLYGWWQRRPASQKKVQPFIDAYAIDMEEYAGDAASFDSFDAFFSRRLRAGARTLPSDRSLALIPADGRYTIVDKLGPDTQFKVKEQHFDLKGFLPPNIDATRYIGGTLLIARLCPVDYHRFHFPVQCTLGAQSQSNGWLYSVNPIALAQLSKIFMENRRWTSILDSDAYGKVIYTEVGATCVGTVTQSCRVGQSYRAGDEKGYFSFGASALVLLFEKDRLELAEDLRNYAKESHEVYCRMGEILGQKREGSESFTVP
jgi:phosphatidylserine decarboxylase